MKYTIKNFLHIANEYVNPDVTNMEGIKKFLIAWFCFEYKTVENDPRLQEMTLEELMVWYQIKRMKDDPNYYNEQINPTTDYEEWLKQEMGDDYVTETENIEQIEESDREYTKKIREKFPDKIHTDFTKLRKEDI